MQNIMLVVVWLASMLLASAGFGQESPPETPAVPATGLAFVNLRYASESASLVYVAYRAQRAITFAGFVQNPRSEYRELILGLATSVGTDGTNALIGVAAARASDSRYVQVYLIPAVRRGSVEFNATIEGYEPLQQAGVRQLGASPANLLWLASRRVALGVTYVGSFQEDAGPSHAFGPSVRVTIPGGSASFDVIRGLREAPSEFRLTVFVRT